MFEARKDQGNAVGKITFEFMFMLPSEITVARTIVTQYSVTVSDQNVISNAGAVESHQENHKSRLYNASRRHEH